MTSNGILEIEFSNLMFTEFNHTWLNSSIIEIYLAPANDRHLDNIFFNMTKLSFNWKVVDFIEKLLTIQINWECASCISPESDQDMLIINLRNATNIGFFYSFETTKDLDPTYRYLVTNVRKQFEQNDFN